MKKIILFSALLLTYTFSYSQYHGGLEIGANMMNADLSLNGDIDTDASWGIRLGYVGEYYLSDNVFARGALLINQRGFNLGDERWGLNVIDLPLNIGYAFNLNKDHKLTLDGGINMEYNFRAFTKVDGESVKLSIGNNEEDIKPFGTGVNFGLGIQFSEKLKVRGNYYNGLTNLLRTEGDEWKNKVIGLSLDFFFPR